MFESNGVDATQSKRQASRYPNLTVFATRPKRSRNLSKDRVRMGILIRYSFTKSSMEDYKE